jgi:hypothetical protein
MHIGGQLDHELYGLFVDQGAEFQLRQPPILCLDPGRANTLVPDLGRLLVVSGSGVWP